MIIGDGKTKHIWKVVWRKMKTKKNKKRRNELSAVAAT